MNPARKPVGAGRTVLITGASAGIGAALARAFAAGDHDLVLVARRRPLLEQLAAELREGHDVRADVLAIDLQDPAAPRRLHRALRGRPVDVLVNNAGFYEVGRFDRMPAERVEQMVQLNVAALASLTRLFLPPMIERGTGHVLNIASVAGFQAIPFLALYAATKAFVVSLTEGLAEELKGTGVRITAVCPGVTETEGVRLARARSRTVARTPAPLIMSEEAVAREAYAAYLAGDVIRVPGVLNQLMTGANRYPRTLTRQVVGAFSRLYVRE